MKNSVLIGCVISVSLMGCHKKADEQIAPPVMSAVPAPAASAVASAVASASASAAPEQVAAVASADLSATTVPVEEDFEKKAAAAVTKPTLKQELDKLDQEIGK